MVRRPIVTPALCRGPPIRECADRTRASPPLHGGPRHKAGGTAVGGGSSRPSCGHRHRILTCIMQRMRADRYDYGFSALAVVLSYLFLLFAQGRGWSAILTIILFVAFAVVVGLPLGILKSRLQSRRRNFR